MTAKDPLEAVFEILKERVPKSVLIDIQEKIKQLFLHLEVVPKRDFEAHQDVMETLKQQVISMEQRLAALEQTEQDQP